MLALRQGDHGFSLAAAEMLVSVVGGNRLLHLFFTQGGGIDQQVMVAGVRLFHAGWSHAHPGQPELHQERTTHGVAILQIDEVNLGPRRRRRLRPGRRKTGGSKNGKQRKCRSE